MSVASDHPSSGMAIAGGAGVANGPFDAIVIGAGAAGLSASAELARRDRLVLVLEARDRIGGRAWSRYEPDTAVPIELGAEFIHGQAIPTRALLRAAGQTAVDVPRTRWVLRNDRLDRGKDLFPLVRDALRKIRLSDDEDPPFVVLLDRLRQAGLSDEACTFARTLVEGFDAADPLRVSARSIVREWSSAPDELQSRPLRGYGALLAMLVDRRVTFGLRRVVHAVRWRRGAVEVEGSFLGNPFRIAARRAIVTLPVGVLQLALGEPGAIAFEPALDRKRHALAGLASGPVLKVVLRLRTAFWETLDAGRYLDASFFHAPAAAFPTLWTPLPVRAPLLVAWAGGPKAERLSGLPSERIVSEAVASVDATFGGRIDVRSQVETAYLHDWQRDPFARGAYSYEQAGGGSARQDLAAPVEDTLFFAGEATDDEGEAGTVAGALQSGIRAARELDESLKHPPPLHPAGQASTPRRV